MVDFLLGLRADVFAAAIYMISSFPGFSKINQDVSMHRISATIHFLPSCHTRFYTYEKRMVDISRTQVIKP